MSTSLWVEVRRLNFPLKLKYPSREISPRGQLPQGGSCGMDVKLCKRITRILYSFKFDQYTPPQYVLCNVQNNYTNNFLLLCKKVFPFALERQEKLVVHVSFLKVIYYNLRHNITVLVGDIVNVQSYLLCCNFIKST